MAFLLYGGKVVDTSAHKGFESCLAVSSQDENLTMADLINQRLIWSSYKGCMVDV